MRKFEQVWDALRENSNRRLEVERKLQALSEKGKLSLKEKILMEELLMGLDACREEDAELYALIKEW